MNRSAERPAVLAGGDRVAVDRRRVGVDEVDPRFVAQFGEHGVAGVTGLVVEAVPLHLGSLHALREQRHGALQHPETSGPGRLLACGEQQLQADADPEEGTTPCSGVERCGPGHLGEAARFQRLAAPSEGTDAGQYHAVGRGDVGGVGGEAGVGPDAL